MTTKCDFCIKKACKNVIKGENMIEFGKPFAGWMDVKIGNKTFNVSYLTDLWAELDYLFNLKDDIIANRIVLEGESFGDLYLTAMMRDYANELIIIWEPSYNEDDEIVVMRFPRKEFMQKYKQAKEKIGMDTYIECFIGSNKYDGVSDVDKFIYDYKMLFRKYPDISFDIEEEIDYDADDEPYISGFHLVATNNKTGERGIIDEE